MFERIPYGVRGVDGDRRTGLPCLGIRPDGHLLDHDLHDDHGPPVRSTGTLDLVRKHSATGLAVVPVMPGIIDLPAEVLDARPTPSLRFVTASGLRMRTEALLAFMDRYGDIVYNSYNATEAGLISTATPADMRIAPRPPVVPHQDERPDSRRRRPRARHRRDRTDRREQLHSTATPSGNTKAFAGNHMVSGDVGRIDGNGLLFVVGRDDDDRSGGENVYPQEVEEVLGAYPGVGRWRDRCRRREVRSAAGRVRGAPARCRTRRSRPQRARQAQLAGYKVPREVHFLDELPATRPARCFKRALGGGPVAGGPEAKVGEDIMERLSGPDALMLNMETHDADAHAQDRGHRHLAPGKARHCVNSRTSCRGIWAGSRGHPASRAAARLSGPAVLGARQNSTSETTSKGHPARTGQADGTRRGARRAGRAAVGPAPSAVGAHSGARGHRRSPGGGGAHPSRGGRRPGRAQHVQGRHIGGGRVIEPAPIDPTSAPADRRVLGRMAREESRRLIRAMPGMVGGFARAAHLKSSTPTLPKPLAVPRNSFNTPSGAVRVCASGDIPLAAVQKIATATETTVNGAPARVIAGAMRAELLSRGEDPGAQVSVFGVCKDITSPRTWGNEIATAAAYLRADLEDPVERVKQTATSWRRPSPIDGRSVSS